MSAPALEIKGLQAWYGESHVLHGVDIVVQPGEVVTLLGRNGAGRTSTMRAIMGLTGSRKGSVKINGVETIHLPTHRIAHLGVGYCPEERGIFSSLSCEENLLLPPMLYAIGTLEVQLDRNGQVLSTHWLRAPRHAPEVVAEIERTVRAAAPFPAPQRLGKVTYTDTWLWDKSGRFQLDTLTEGQD